MSHAKLRPIDGSLLFCNVIPVFRIFWSKSMFLTQNISARTKMPGCQHWFPYTRGQYEPFDICQPMTYRRLDPLEKK